MLYNINLEQVNALSQLNRFWHNHPKCIYTQFYR